MAPSRVHTFLKTLIAQIIDPQLVSSQVHENVLSRAATGLVKRSGSRSLRKVRSRALTPVFSKKRVLIEANADIKENNSGHADETQETKAD